MKDSSTRFSADEINNMVNLHDEPTLKYFNLENASDRELMQFDARSLPEGNMPSKPGDTYDYSDVPTILLVPVWTFIVIFIITALTADTQTAVDVFLYGSVISVVLTFLLIQLDAWEENKKRREEKKKRRKLAKQSVPSRPKNNPAPSIDTDWLILSPVVVFIGVFFYSAVNFDSDTGANIVLYGAFITIALTFLFIWIAGIIENNQSREQKKKAAQQGKRQ